MGIPGIEKNTCKSLLIPNNALLQRVSGWSPNQQQYWELIINAHSWIPSLTPMESEPLGVGPSNRD